MATEAVVRGSTPIYHSIPMYCLGIGCPAVTAPEPRRATHLAASRYVLKGAFRQTVTGPVPALGASLGSQWIGYFSLCTHFVLFYDSGIYIPEF